MHDKKYYITDSNLKGLAYKCEIIENDLSEIYSEVLDRLGLKDFTSKKEVEILQIVLTFIKHADDYSFNRHTKHQNRAANRVAFVSPPAHPSIMPQPIAARSAMTSAIIVFQKKYKSAEGMRWKNFNILPEKIGTLFARERRMCSSLG
jgi:hypothetical protein